MQLTFPREVRLRSKYPSGVLIALFLSMPIFASSPDVEELRISKARFANANMVTRYQRFAEELSASLPAANTKAMRSALVARIARALWQRAVTDSTTALADDRALYWGRLALRVSLRENLQRESLESPEYNSELASLLSLLEQHSRGLRDIHFPENGTLKILITGFDPFRLDQNVSQSNPSGLAALMLDGKTLNHGAVPARIEAATMPVRFEDFDLGIIEDFLTPHFRANHLALMVTISMGRSGFDLERFPGLRRSAIAGDNRNVVTGADSKNPLIPHLGTTLLDGPEFVEFSLPTHSMLRAIGAWPVVDNRQVRTLERGAFAAKALRELADQTSVSGSGGGYLSNEISYRSILLHQRLLADFPIGHIHTPSVDGYDEAVERRIVAQILGLLVRAIEASPNPRQSEH
ncbi:MAG: hypothetical protein O7E57_02365 [Gammaproteobacteria bacterium]|nr:hypothetical protein [Gammaproteobacteria bacterium]